VKTKVLVGILLFLIVVNLSTVGVFVYHTFTGGPGDSRPFPFERNGQPGMMGGQSPMMSLEPETRERMHELMMAFHEEVGPLQDRIFQLEDSTVALLKNDPPPMERINSNLKRLSELRLSLNQKAVYNLLRARTFLTPQQQDTFFRAIMEARPQGGRMMGGGAGGGPMRGRGMRGGMGRLDSDSMH